MEALDGTFQRVDAAVRGASHHVHTTRFLAVARSLIAIATIAGVAWGAVALTGMLLRVSLSEWGQVTIGAGATFVRVAVALAIAFAWTVPLGVAIGLNARLARVVQPLAQVAASVPATALFPVLLALLVRAGGGMSLASVLLMLLGIQRLPTVTPHPRGIGQEERPIRELEPGRWAEDDAAAGLLCPVAKLSSELGLPV